MKWLVALFALSTFAAHAADVQIKCEMRDVAYVSQFNLELSVDAEADVLSDVGLDLELRSAGTARDTRSLSITREFTLRQFPAGELSLKPFFVMTSVGRNLEPVYVNLAVNYPQAFSSQIRFADGTTFFSTCKTVE